MKVGRKATSPEKGRYNQREDNDACLYDAKIFLQPRPARATPMEDVG